MAGRKDEAGKLVFVTVGTTSFDELIRAATDEKLLKVCLILSTVSNKPVRPLCCFPSTARMESGARFTPSFLIFLLGSKFKV